jgi:hypothetical protein
MPEQKSESWQEIGQNFKDLGENLAAAFKAAYQNEETRQHLAEVQVLLTKVVDEVKRAGQNIAAAPEVQQVKEEVKKAAQTAKTTGQEAAVDWQPHLTAALQAVKVELDQLIQRLEQSKPAADEKEAE